MIFFPQEEIEVWFIRKTSKWNIVYLSAGYSVTDIRFSSIDLMRIGKLTSLWCDPILVAAPCGATGKTSCLNQEILSLLCSLMFYIFPIHFIFHPRDFFPYGWPCMHWHSSKDFQYWLLWEFFFIVFLKKINNIWYDATPVTSRAEERLNGALRRLQIKARWRFFDWIER